MDYNYHTHTFRCNHATETPEEYVRVAIENGIRYMGFSEHFPYRSLAGVEAGYRMPVSQVGEYFDELNELRDRYKKVVEIKIGFEMEYFPEVFDVMLGNAIEYGAEYLILGQHFNYEDRTKGEYLAKETDDVEVLGKYVENVVEAIKSGVFTYVAHPDIINFVGDIDVYTEYMRKICKASAEYGVPLEINFLGMRTNRNYPNESFWKIAGEEGSLVTFGFDSHGVVSAYDGESQKRAEELVERYGLNYIGRPELVKIG